MAVITTKNLFALLFISIAFILARFPNSISRVLPLGLSSLFNSNHLKPSGPRTMSTTASVVAVPKTEDEWKAALNDLPATPEKIPAFFFGHGSPILQYPDELLGRGDAMEEYAGPKGPLARFLKDFGPTLLEKYKPKGILVFSAHWETHGERQGMALFDNNPF